ncbi:MAG: DedA family protein [Candidatus Curtissbacteria bacterium]|nr:DedA family protein [Candidatus Curtissbacteria bacterium]
MIEQIIEPLATFITNWIASLGYPAIFVLMTLESALIPIPSEVTLPHAGFVVAIGKFNLWLVVLIGALGNLVGSLLAYALGYWGQETFVRNLIKKYGKFLLLTIEDFDQAEKWFREHGGKIAFFSRLLPVVRTFISLPAGISEMNVVRFSIFTFAGSFIWSAFLTYLGVILGQNWHTLGDYFHKFDVLIVIGALALIAAYVYHKLKKIKKTS